MGSRLNSNNPKGVQKAVTRRLLVGRGIWKYAEFKSKTENTTAPANCSNACSTVGMGYESNTILAGERRKIKMAAK